MHAIQSAEYVCSKDRELHSTLAPGVNMIVQ